jgi:hypothetical protein
VTDIGKAVERKLCGISKETGHSQTVPALLAQDGYGSV